jgi:hypothetical protein
VGEITCRAHAGVFLLFDPRPIRLAGFFSLSRPTRGTLNLDQTSSA